jgi:FG-GAP repeat
MNSKLLQSLCQEILCLYYIVLVVSPTLPTLGTQWRIAGVGDFNGDGYADIVWQNASTGQIVVWLLQNGVLSD